MATKRVNRIREVAEHKDDGRTLQSQQEATDINTLLKHYRKTGTFTHISHEIPQYGDFSNVSDFLDVQIQVKVVEKLFMECSAEVRARFGNEPSQLLDFLADPANEQEAINLGLAEGKIVTIEPEVQAEPASSQPDAEAAENPVQGGE